MDGSHLEVSDGYFTGEIQGIYIHKGNLLMLDTLLYRNIGPAMVSLYSQYAQLFLC